MVIASQLSRLAAGSAVVAGAMVANQQRQSAKAADSYPPNGLSPGVQGLPEWIRLGCGSTEYICAERDATFSSDNPPANLPDLSKHNSFFADAMRADPSLWDQLKNKETALGVKLSHCIKTGIDNKGHPMIKTVGAVAGDEESYEMFRAFFDPVISARHNGYDKDAKHPTDLDVRKLSTTKIDPSGKYIMTSRCRTGRSVRGTRLPPCTTFDERREVERVVVKGLLAMDGDLKGDYFPLNGSRSYAPKPTGMSVEKEESLRSKGNLFQEPDSTLLLSSGCGRHWPDARGIFHNEAENLFVWVNEEDQLRIVSMEWGDNVKSIIERFAKATATIQECLEKEGYGFMHTEHLGWILTCPSNLGTGLRAGAMVKVPLVSGRKDFKAICARMGLQARGTGGVDSASTGGTWDISNADRLGKSEVELVNIFIEGVAQIIRWEEALEAGKNVDAEIAAAGMPRNVTIEVPFTSLRNMDLTK